jgi:hypothetical protein
MQISQQDLPEPKVSAKWICERLPDLPDPAERGIREPAGADQAADDGAAGSWSGGVGWPGPGGYCEPSC